MAGKGSEHQLRLAESARRAAEKARASGTDAGKATGRLFDRIAKAHAERAGKGK